MNEKITLINCYLNKGVKKRKKELIKKERNISPISTVV